MVRKIFASSEGNVLSILAFSIYGLLFAMRPATWLPTIIILCCAFSIALNKNFRRNLIQVISDYSLQLIFVPFLVWFIVCLFVGFWHWGFAKNAFSENPFRIFISLSLFALSMSIKVKKYFVYGLLTASICALLNVVYGYFIYDEYFPRISGTTNHPIHFGNLSAILSILLMSISMLLTSCGPIFRIICLFGSLMAFVAVTASQSRSSYLLLICLAPLFFMSGADSFHRWLIRIGYITGFALMLFVAVNPVIQDKLRFKEAISDIQMIDNGNYQGSFGSRLAMWQSAWVIFKAHPFAGIGTQKFKSEFIEQMKTGEVPKADAEHNQPHNDLLNAAATGGIIKVIAYIFLISGPFIYFFRRYVYLKTIHCTRIFPLMGMQVVGAFFLTGLTNSNFDLQIYSTTYAVLVCVLAKLSMQNESES